MHISILENVWRLSLLRFLSFCTIIAVSLISLAPNRKKNLCLWLSTEVASTTQLDDVVISLLSRYTFYPDGIDNLQYNSICTISILPCQEYSVYSFDSDQFRPRASEGRNCPRNALTWTWLKLSALWWTCLDHKGVCYLFNYLYFLHVIQSS